MYGVLRATCGSNPLGVDDENEFPNALNTTQIPKWKQGNYKGHHHSTFHVCYNSLKLDAKRLVSPLGEMIGNFLQML